jgi:hypothetical protein
MKELSLAHLRKPLIDVSHTDYYPRVDNYG